MIKFLKVTEDHLYHKLRRPSGSFGGYHHDKADVDDHHHHPHHHHNHNHQQKQQQQQHQYYDISGIKLSPKHFIDRTSINNATDHNSSMITSSAKKDMKNESKSDEQMTYEERKEKMQKAVIAK